jgi:hypothetical protein
MPTSGPTPLLSFHHLLQLEEALLGEHRIKHRMEIQDPVVSEVAWEGRIKLNKVRK